MNLTPSVADLRVLRATAFMPRVLALTLLVMTPIAASAGSNRPALAQMVGSALLLWIAAVLLERGVFAAAIVIAVACGGTVLLGVFETARRLGGPTSWSDLGTLAFLCVPTALACRAVLASRRLTRLGRRPRPGLSTLRKLGFLPRDVRLARSAGPFVAAYAMWAAGAAAALAVAAVVPGGHGLLGSLTFLPFAIVGGRIFDAGRRRLALRLDEVRVLDRRPPLLLLRSFADDNLPLERRFRLLGNLLQRPFSLEELIVDRLWAVGPVTAIGRPDETLSPAGAARQYVPEAVWRDRLLASLDESSWVVGVLGDSAGVMWEFLQVEAKGAVDRFVLIVPPHPPPVIVARWHALSRVMPAAATADLRRDATAGPPLAAVFPSGGRPALYCCKYQNETSYGMALDEIFRRSRSSARS